MVFLDHRPPFAGLRIGFPILVMTLLESQQPFLLLSSRFPGLQSTFFCFRLMFPGLRAKFPWLHMGFSDDVPRASEQVSQYLALDRFYQPFAMLFSMIGRYSSFLVSVYLLWNEVSLSSNGFPRDLNSYFSTFSPRYSGLGMR